MSAWLPPTTPPFTIGDVEHYLQQALRGQIRSADKLDRATYGQLWRAIAKLIRRGGKRLRPSLVLLAYEAYGGNRPSIIAVAASQELFHGFLLMHDDIIDRDLVRWGGPNISGVFFEEFSNQHGRLTARQYADDYALLAGDACYGLANELLLGSDFAAEQVLRASRLVQATLQTVIGGELLDVAATVRPKQRLTRHQILNISRYKTASYSFVTPLQLGALFAGAQQAEMDLLATVGTNLGIAFQLRDDLLGMFGDDATTGKPSISDLREGKQTLLTLEAYERASPSERRLLDDLNGKPTATPVDLERMRRLLVTLGARSAVERACLSYARQARNAIVKLTITEPAREQLLRLADFTVSRNF